MISRSSPQHRARTKLTVPAGATINHRLLAACALVSALSYTSVASAQCDTAGLAAMNPQAKQATIAAVAAASTSTSSLVATIHAANTMFLAQSAAFIGSPPDPQPDQMGGGVWTRGIGGHVTFGTDAIAGQINFGGRIAGSITCHSRTLGDFAGLQIGADIARLNVNGWNLHAGSTVGYLGSMTRDGTPPGPNPPASFRDTLQIPFVGAYFAASKGGLLVDGQVREDFYQNDVSDNTNGLSGQRFGARGTSLSANVAYNQIISGNWFVEPSAGIIWSRTQVDPLFVPGTIVSGQGSVPPWVLGINDIESTLGRLSVRVGTSLTSADVVLQPFASASILHEFEGQATSGLTSDYSAVGSAAPSFSSMVSVKGPQTYGQFGLGLAAQLVNTGWLSYLRADYRRGSNIEGWSLNGGLRYQFVPDPTTRGRGATIGKAPVAKAPAAQALYDWSGFYLGGQLGADWGSTRWTLAGDGTTSPRFAGFLAGGAIGYNHQAGKWVFGIEGDTNWTNARGARPCPNSHFLNCETDVNWLSLATARLGYTYWDRLLLYAKGGAAVAQDRAQIACNNGSQPTIVPLVGCPAQSDFKIKTGWTVGWGSEFGLTRNMSVSSEIMYFNLGNDRSGLSGFQANIQKDGFISSVGLHIRFGSEPTLPAVVAKN